MVREGGAMIIVSALIAVCRLSSVTWRVKVNAPAAIGVPKIVRVSGTRSSPDATEAPLARLQRYGGTPPVATAGNFWLYGVPTAPPGRAADTAMLSTGRVTTTEKFFDVVAPAASATWITKLNVPAVCGVPRNVPV